eukprot:4088414-Amphidinium_carterae.1
MVGRQHRRAPPVVAEFREVVVVQSDRMPRMRDKLLQVPFHDVPVGSKLLSEGDLNLELELQELLDDRAG